MSAGLGVERAVALDLGMTLRSQAAQSLHLPSVDEKERLTRPKPQRVVVKIKAITVKMLFKAKTV